MNRWSAILMTVLFFGLTTIAVADDSAVRFAAIDIMLESDEPVAAWQFELQEKGGHMTVVGVENGESPAFARAPYFDREAVQLGVADRIIVADYSLAPSAALPREKTRIATIHIRLSGDRPADFDLRLIAAADAGGKNIDAVISVRHATGS